MSAHASASLWRMFDSRTLPGWPDVYDPSVLEMLFLTVLVPFGIAAVFAVLILAPGWRQRDDA